MPEALKAEDVVAYYDRLVESQWNPTSEKAFQVWYKRYAEELDLNPDPDSKLHYYNWRAAFLTKTEPDKKGHWPSIFKKLGHPNRFIKGKDTIVEE